MLFFIAGFSIYFFLNKPQHSKINDWQIDQPLGLLKGDDQKDLKLVEIGQQQEGVNIVPGTIAEPNDKKFIYRKEERLSAYYNPVLKIGNAEGEKLWNALIMNSTDYRNRERMNKPYEGNC